MTREIDSKALAQMVRVKKDPALVLFYGNWCGDCREFKPAWVEWTARRDGPIFTVEVLRGGPEWKEWNLDEIPTVAAYSKGEEIGRAYGVVTKDDLDSLWKEKLLLE